MLNIPVPIEPAFKIQAETVAANKGTTLGTVIAELLRQWMLYQGAQGTEQVHPLYETEEEFNAKMQKAKEDCEAGRTYTSAEVHAHMHAKYGI